MLWPSPVQRFYQLGFHALSTDRGASFTPVQYIDLTHLKLSNKSLRRLNLPRFANTLHRLGLRQNEISKITSRDIGSLTNLKELDLYDNGLEKTYGDVLQQGCSQLE